MPIRPYPNGIAWDEAWRQRQRADRLALQLNQAEQAIRYWAGGVGETVTCLECGIRDQCGFAWEPYNTDGDCLAEK